MPLRIALTAPETKLALQNRRNVRPKLLMYTILERGHMHHSPRVEKAQSAGSQLSAPIATACPQAEFPQDVTHDLHALVQGERYVNRRMGPISHRFEVA